MLATSADLIGCKTALKGQRVTTASSVQTFDWGKDS